MTPLVPSIGFGGGPGASRLDQANDHFMEDHMKFCRDVGATHVRGDATWTYDSSTKGYSLSFSDSDRFFYWAYKYGLEVVLNIHARSSARFFGGTSSIPRLTAGELPTLKAAALEVCKRYVGPTATFHNGTSVALQSGPPGTVTGAPANGCTVIETHNEPQQIGDCTDQSTGGLLDPNQLGPEGQHVWPAGGYPERIHLIIRDTAQVVHDWYHDAWVVGGAWGGMSHNPAATAGSISGRRDRTFFDLLVYANQTQGGNPLRANLMPAVLTATLNAGDTVAHIDDATMFRSGGGTAYVKGQSFTYAGKTSNTLTGIPASGAGSITATRASGSKVHDRSSGYVDEWSCHIYQMAGSDPNFQTAFNVRNLNSIFVDEASGAHRKSFQNLIDSYPCGANTDVGITEGHQAGSKRWNKFQKTYPLPSGTDYTPAAGSNTTDDVNWEGPLDRDQHGVVHPASQLDQATTMRHAGDRIGVMMSAGLRLRRFIPHVAIDGNVPANIPEPGYWQHVRGHVRLPITNGNYSNTGAVFTRYIDATPTGNPRTGGWGGPQWKEAADAFYDTFANAAVGVGPPTPTLTDQPSDPTADTTPTFSWSNAQTSSIEHRYRIDGGAWTTVAGSTGTHTFGVLGLTAHTFNVQAHDTSSGLYSAIRSYSFSITGVPDNLIRPKQRGSHVVYKGITTSESIADPGVPAGVGILVGVAIRGTTAPVVPAGFKLRKSTTSGTYLWAGVYEYTVVGNEPWPLTISGLGTSDHIIVVSTWDDVNPDDWIETPQSNNSAGASNSTVVAPGYTEAEANAIALSALMTTAGTTWNPVAGWTEKYDEKEVAGTNCATALEQRDTDPLLDELVAGFSSTTLGPGRWAAFSFGAKGPAYTGPVTVLEQPADTISTDARIRVSYPIRGMTYEGNLDGVGWGAMSAILDISGLSTGPHTFLVRGIFTGGETTPITTLEWTVLVDEPPPVPEPPTVQRLGCGTTQVNILPRGGVTIQWASVPFTSAAWGRTDRDTSEATITIDGATRTCLDQVAQLEEWVHEIAVYRDNVLVWVGPLVGVAISEAGQVTLSGLDMSVWLGRRSIYSDLRYVAPTDAATVAEGIIRSAMSVDNSPRLGVVRLPSGLKLTRTFLAADHLNARQEIDNLAQLLHWTTVNRRIRLDTAQPAVKPVLNDASFATPPAITRDGSQVYNRVTVIGTPAATPVEATARDGAGEIRQGVLHSIQRNESILTLSEAEVTAQEALAEAVARPVISGGQLSYEAPLAVSTLVPGVVFGVNIVDSPIRVQGDYVLVSVAAQSSASQEAISVSLLPV